MNEFARRLKAARIAAGYEHAKNFADAHGYDRHTYRHWEAGRHCPDLATFHSLCRILKVEPNHLLPLTCQKKAA